MNVTLTNLEVKVLHIALNIADHPQNMGWVLGIQAAHAKKIINSLRKKLAKENSK